MLQEGLGGEEQTILDFGWGILGFRISDFDIRIWGYVCHP